MIDKILNLIGKFKSDFEPDVLKQLMENVLAVISHKSFSAVLEKSPKLAKTILQSGIALEDLVVRVQSIVDNTVFWKKLAVSIKFSDFIDVGLSAVNFAVSFSVTAFGNWDRHRELLIMMKTAVESIPSDKRGENYKTIIKAMELLIDKYDTEFWDKIGNGFKDALPDFAVSLGKWGLSKALAVVCPVGAGAIALVDAAGFFIKYATNTREEANMVRMRQFYMLLSQSIFEEFSNLYEDGATFSSVYDNAETMVQMLLNMAIYANQMAQKVKEYTASDKVIYTNNVNRIKDNFQDYLY